MKFTIILSAIFTVLQLFTIPSYARVPDDVGGRLWRLAKVWGFAKYYHPNNCNVNWNELMLTAIDSVLVSTSNENFNLIISDLLDAAGPVPPATEPLVITADINLNAHFEWFEDPFFSGIVRNQLNTILTNFRPKPSCLIKINDFTDMQYTSWIDFRMDEINIPSFTYTNESHRMLAYFYYWNTINYFHADKDLMDQAWDTTLLQFIPVFRGVETETDFHVRLLNLATYLDDSHGFTFSPLTNAYFGTYYPLVKLDFIENETVVTRTTPETPDIALGDIVRKVNGIDISFLRDSLSDYAAASNDAALMLDVHRRMLRGQSNSLISLVLEDASGEVYMTTMTRNSIGADYFGWVYSNNNATYSITDCGYGYVDMGELMVNQVPLMYAFLKNTPGIIFDIRNYPNGTIWALIPLFYKIPMTWALFTEPDPTFPGWYFWLDNIYHAGIFSNPQAYSGKVIILANAETQSQAEYTVMGLQQHPKAFTIGSQTSGADGNISYLELPGSLKTYWTSLGIFYPDSTTAQRVGVRIDSVVMPTIEDVRHGRDAELSAALDCLISTTNEVPVLSEINIYPNPAKDIFYLSSEELSTRKMHVEAFDPLGHLVFQQTNFVSNQNSIAIDAALWPNGIYLLCIKDEDGISGNKKSKSNIKNDHPRNYQHAPCPEQNRRTCEADVLDVSKGHLLTKNLHIRKNMHDENRKLECQWSARSCKKGFAEQIKSWNADMICLQETKAQVDEVKEALKTIDGYDVYASSAVKKGYSGTSLLTKTKPIAIETGIGVVEHDQEGRVVAAEYEKFFLVTAYIPNSGNGLGRLEYREQWDRDFTNFIKKLQEKKPVIACGDFNVAHQPIDIARPKQNYNKTSGYTQQEIDGMTTLLGCGLVDTFRHLRPSEVGYSWWNQRFGAREKNIGWRIDYFLVSDTLMPSVTDSYIMSSEMGSDHCPVAIIINA